MYKSCMILVIYGTCSLNVRHFIVFYFLLLLLYPHRLYMHNINSCFR
nr:MAG TPA: hypothetical protein [Caudoviricetes sp.]